MTYPTADLVRMMLRNHPFFVEQAKDRKPRIFEDSDYDHPWYALKDLKKPNPPTEEQIKKAQFVDKTYEWKKK